MKMHLAPLFATDFMSVRLRGANVILKRSVLYATSRRPARRMALRAVKMSVVAVLRFNV